MRAFGYLRAESAEEAIDAAAADPGAVFLGGGTNLVDLMRLGVATPDTLIDVSRLQAEVAPLDGGGLRIGAGVRNSDLAGDLRIRRDFPVLSQALLSGASGQLRNMATVGGNLLQRTRCLYFQDISKPCNKRLAGSGCPARSGIHRDLGVLGTSTACIATHPSDMAVALAALDAVVVVQGPDGDRRLRLDEFYRLPGDDPTRDTTLADGELITAVELPAASALSRQSRYRKARDRASFAFAVGSVAAAITLVDDRVDDVRLAFGAVAPRPWRARIAEDAIRGGPVNRDAFAAALAAEFSAARPLPDNAFKVPLARNLGLAVLSDLAGITDDADGFAEHGPVGDGGPAGRPDGSDGS
jgi:xanthine dehydrogenase YagS FAD-binding subunit